MTDNVVNIVNMKQASVYIKNGIKPTDIYYTDRLVFVFEKEKTESIFKRWINHEFE